MRHILVEMAFCGKNYHGYQVQKNALAVAQVVQDCVEEVIGVREDIVGCSRTDKGVHANSYFFTMRTQCKISLDSFTRSVNHILPMDIVIKNMTQINNDFHPRYDCEQKEYIYIIHNGQKKDPFRAGQVMEYPFPIDVDKLDSAARRYVGTYDFRGLCGINREYIEDTTRTIYSARVYKQGDDVVFQVAGDGFLYKMVRIMVGTLLAVNENKLTIEDINRILNQQTRDAHSKTVPPDGLYLNKITFCKDRLITENI